MTMCGGLLTVGGHRVSGDRRGQCHGSFDQSGARNGAPGSRAGVAVFVRMGGRRSSLRHERPAKQRSYVKTASTAIPARTVPEAAGRRLLTGTLLVLNTHQSRGASPKDLNTCRRVRKPLGSSDTGVEASPQRSVAHCVSPIHEALL